MLNLKEMKMDWDKDLSEETRNQMKFLGWFSPTARESEGFVKGYMIDADSGEGCGTYLDSKDLRDLAAACNLVAEWLDRRKEASE